jgi:hypothetical protein
VYRECTAKKAARNGLFVPPTFSRTFRRSSTSLPSDFRKSHHACKMHSPEIAMAEPEPFQGGLWRPNLLIFNVFLFDTLQSSVTLM